MNKGVLYGAGAYILWGLLPLYWKALQHVPALEILAHRMVWSLGVVLLLVAMRGQWRRMGNALRNRRVVITFMATALLLSLNWYVYIWAVNAGYVVEASLGYFINPLVNVLLGVLFLKERLRRWQSVSMAIALAGVIYLTVTYGSLPWIALLLAGSFGLYGLFRKMATLNSLEGLTLETLLLFAPALAYLVYLQVAGRGTFGHTDASTTILLIGSGVATAVPLLLFAAGARLIPLTLMGVLQYFAPTLQFLIGVLVYREPLDLTRFLGFCLIWLALVIYTIEGFVQSRKAARQRVPGTSVPQQA